MTTTTTATAAKRQSYLPPSTAAAITSSNTVGIRLKARMRSRKSTAREPRSTVRDRDPDRLV